LKDSLYPKFFKWLEDFGLKEGEDYTFNKTDKDLKLSNGSVIMFRSLQNYNMIRGGEASGALLDEARDMEREAFEVILGRMREKNNAKIRITTTPAGFNWIHDLIKDNNCEMYSMKTEENTSLPENYIANLKKTYSSDFLRQELYAEFVNFAGRLVYSDFRRNKNITKNILKLSQDDTIHIGMDFNVDPFCATVATKKAGVFYIFDEIILHGLSLDAMIAEIKRRYGDRNIIIYPDSSGKNRTLIGITSYISELVKAFGRENIKYFSKNPRISERINIVNKELKSGNIIISEKCVYLIKDFERVKFAESGAFEIAKHEKDLTHVSDALGYMVYYQKAMEANRWQQT